MGFQETELNELVNEYRRQPIDEEMRQNWVFCRCPAGRNLSPSQSRRHGLPTGLAGATHVDSAGG